MAKQKRIPAKDNIELTKIKLASKDNKHYFYGVLALVLVVVIFRPDHANNILTIVLSAGGGLGFAQMIKK